MEVNFEGIINKLIIKLVKLSNRASSLLSLKAKRPHNGFPLLISLNLHIRRYKIINKITKRYHDILNLKKEMDKNP